MSSVLSIIEDDSYVATRVVKKKDKKVGSVLVFSNLVIGDAFYNINWEEVDRLELNGFELDINKYHLISKDSDVIILKPLLAFLDLDEFSKKVSEQGLIILDEKDQSLLDGVELNKNFNSFPELKNVAYRLVDLKLSNPELSDIERMQFVLEELKNKRK